MCVLGISHVTSHGLTRFRRHFRDVRREIDVKTQVMTLKQLYSIVIYPVPRPTILGSRETGPINLQTRHTRAFVELATEFWAGVQLIPTTELPREHFT